MRQNGTKKFFGTKRIAMKLVAGLLGVVILLSGCGKKNVDQLEKIQDAGKIVIAMEGVWAPWTYHDESGELVGFDTEVGKAIAEKLGVKAEFAEGDWSGLLAGMEVGRFDTVINGVEVDEDRAEKYTLSEPYCYIHTVLVVRNDNDEIKSFEDLKGKTTANSLDSTYMHLGEQYGAKVLGVDSLSETMEMVVSGRVDATLNADVSFFDYLNEHPDAPVKIVATTEDASEVIIPLKKDDTTKALCEAINKAIKELREDGTLSRLSIKYFGSDISSK